MVVTHLYIALLQELQHAVAGLRQGLTNVQSTLNKRQWHEYLHQVLQEPLQRYSLVQQSSDAFMEVPTLGLPDTLIRRGSKCLSKGKETQVRRFSHACNSVLHLLEDQCPCISLSLATIMITEHKCMC